ncbi:hypothetical protein WJX72_005226 [[Myrmecia] bisecta]|uniref:Tetratricopeptide repeat protein n=1 Tax=[Myrmecia] bisecta TaxID=41462 RepID=A0AAW1R6I5_9CHLO
MAYLNSDHRLAVIQADQFDQGLVDDFEATAYQAYADRDFEATVQLLNELIANNPSAPQMPRWLEMRAQVLLDGKNFGAAVTDYNAAIQQSADLDKAVRARLIAGRALAHEGDADWASALADYDQAITLAAEAGQMPDPYVLNSRGNAHASLGQWAEARADYLQSATVFQKAKGFRGRQGSTTMRLDGAVFAASNAAIMLAQLGDEAGALQEMRKIARRAPGSADMRAALAALYWAQGDRAAAEGEWQYACDRVSVGCSKYMDRDWLSRIRRWPPRMVERMQDFLAIRQAGTS